MITPEQVKELKEFHVRVLDPFYSFRIGDIIIARNEFSDINGNNDGIKIPEQSMSDGRSFKEDGFWLAKRFDLVNRFPKTTVRENNIKLKTEVCMEEKEIIQVKKRCLCIIKVKRDIDGLTVFIQSEILETYFRNASGGVVQVGKVAWNKDIEGYRYPSVPLEISGLARCPKLDHYDRDYLIDNNEGIINLSFLRMKGLTEGISMRFKGLYLEKDIQMLRKDIQTFITAFYTEYIRLCEFEITINTVS